MENLITFAPYVIIGVVIVAILIDLMGKIRVKQGAYLVNDLRNDYQRWDSTDLKVAAYIAMFVEDEIRLNNYFQNVVYAILKRSPRAIDEKIRRINTIGSDKSDASSKDEDTAYLIAQFSEQQAKKEFVSDLYVSGASAKQIAVVLEFLQ